MKSKKLEKKKKNPSQTHNNKTQIQKFKQIPTKPTTKPMSYNKTQIQKIHSKPTITSETTTTSHCKSTHIRSGSSQFGWFEPIYKSFRTKNCLNLFQVVFNSNPNLMIFNADLVRVGSDLVHNIEIFFIFTCLCGWYSLLPIKDQSTDRHLDENHHRICWKINLRWSWSMPVKGKSPTMI